MATPSQVLRMLLLFFFAAMNVDIISYLVDQNPRVMTKLGKSYLPSIDSAVTSSLLLRCISLVYMFAFLSALPQIAGLCGDGRFVDNQEVNTEKGNEVGFALIPTSHSLKSFRKFVEI